MNKWHQECDTIENKKGLNQIVEGIQSLVGFANASGGTVCFGSRNDGAIIGLDVTEKTLRDVANRIATTTDPPLIAEVRPEEIDGKTVLLARVAASADRPHTYEGVPYIRSGSATRQMPQTVFRQMLDERVSSDLTARKAPNSSMSDLSTEALTKFKELITSQDNYWENKELPQVLTDLFLMDGDTLTYAGLLLLGKPLSIQRFLPQAEVRYFWYDDDADTQYSAHNRETSSLPIILQLDSLLSNLRVSITNVQFGLFRLEVRNFDLPVLQEAILNAIMHRDYRMPSHVFIRQYPSRIEIESPGRFMGGITSENIIVHPPQYRNLRLANALARVFAVQQAGQGVDLMVSDLAQRGQDLSYRETDSSVVLSLPSGVYDSDLFAFFVKVQEAGHRLGVVDFLILRYIKETHGSALDGIVEQLKPFPAERVRNAIRHLHDREILDVFGERRGRKYFLAKSFYEQLGRQGEISRIVGPSPEGIEATILTHLGRFQPATLHDFLMALSVAPGNAPVRRRVSRVLHRLLEKGVLASEGEKRWTKYRLNTQTHNGYRNSEIGV